jgi:hypothetical protein
MLASVAYVAGFSWDKQPWHVQVAQGTDLAKIFKMTDVHEFTGNVDQKTGATGTVMAHCINGSVADYTMKLVDTDHQNTSSSLTVDRYNATLTIGGTDYSGRLTYESRTTAPTITTGYLEIISGTSVAQLGYGPNPPPPACDISYDTKTCHAVPPTGACVWCDSADKTHHLCFAAKNPPPRSSWSCA